MTSENILIIKLSALGDFVQALGPMQAIRRHHPDAKLTLLTTKPFVDIAERSGWFQEVIVDKRPKLLNIKAMLQLRNKLRAGKFARVYDLQTSDRSSSYYRLMGNPKPEWSGIAKGSSHPHANPNRDFMHTVDRQAEQLSMAGITDVPFPDVSWMEADPSKFGLPENYALLIPGGAPHRPDKRWPGSSYGQLAARLVQEGITPVVLGTKAEEKEAQEIQAECPETISLLGKTTLFEIAALARKARFSVGNDTGPTHLAAIAGAPTLALFSHASNPDLCGQRGPEVEILRVPDLSNLPVPDVFGKLRSIAHLSQPET
ncbi:glycosyltransferase family 9 protein [Curvivirga aplysinae]|uniref:glycosyltransferase family 9 protein n=1 Tax=Curvivirga aplysinae TaxID=2529852 RepID=UPI0012BBCF9D|nr:glycosyltransferase family 9 protein [Curvivirga aplysinae]MTI09894.1 lipopolysaccharide heptosyltransferase family protein [Curvivirga aplysinae]